jgi:hypothetical protein
MRKVGGWHIADQPTLRSLTGVDGDDESDRGSIMHEHRLTVADLGPELIKVLERRDAG